MAKRFNTIQIVLTLAVLLLAVAVVAFVLGRNAVQMESQAPPVAAEVPRQPASREISLYFASPEGIYLVAEKRTVDECAEEIDCVRTVIAELSAGPTGPLLAVLPPSAQLLQVSEADGVATLNFNRAFAAAHPGGSASELLTVYALADTLSVNFPHIRQVRFLLEGEELESLKGHVDLRRPIAADFRYTRLAAPETAASQEGIHE